MRRNTGVMLGMMAAGLVMLALPVHANTIDYALDGSFTEWSTDYPGFLAYTDPGGDIIGLGSGDNYDHKDLDILATRQSIGHLTSDLTNWYVVWGWETAAPFQTYGGDEAVRGQVFVNNPLVDAGAGNAQVADYPSLSRYADFYTSAQIASYDPGVGENVIVNDGQTYKAQLTKWNSGTNAWQTVPNSQTHAWFAYHNTATNGYVELAVRFDDLGFTRNPAVPDPFGFAVTDDDMETVSRHADLAPNAGTGNFGGNGAIPGWDGDWSAGFTPEPGTVSLFLVGLVGLATARRRKA